MAWSWHVGEPFQFFVQKRPGSNADTTEARYYIYDRKQKKWRHSAAISSPNGDAKCKKSVATIGGGLNSFLENFAGKDRELPKVALYRLWFGASLDKLKCLTQAEGDGTWGQLHDAYFLAEGSKKDLDTAFDRVKKQYGSPVFGRKEKKLDPISDKPVPPEVLEGLKKLPRAKKVEGK